MRKGNIQVLNVAFDCRSVHGRFANITFRITTGGSQIKEEWIPGGLTNAGLDCPDDFEEQLIVAFFSGFRKNLPEHFLGLGYKIEILSHWYHPTDSTESAYSIAGKKAAEDIMRFPDVFLLQTSENK